MVLCFFGLARGLWLGVGPEPAVMLAMTGVGTAAVQVTRPQSLATVRAVACPCGMTANTPPAMAATPVPTAATPRRLAEDLRRRWAGL